MITERKVVQHWIKDILLGTQSLTWDSVSGCSFYILEIYNPEIQTWDEYTKIRNDIHDVFITKSNETYRVVAIFRSIFINHSVNDIDENRKLVWESPPNASYYIVEIYNHLIKKWVKFQKVNNDRNETSLNLMKLNGLYRVRAFLKTNETTWDDDSENAESARIGFAMHLINGLHTSGTIFVSNVSELLGYTFCSTFNLIYRKKRMGQIYLV